ncbi:DUF899 family protein [Paenisporosarcina quisquiliarum]|uniref:DUF899 family protein n=1 Tax=Paenisporosarcina quisquiliarum TaxID=365346 RepID=A0A9X3LI43_9BACL|nr:DUF899 family protein [Paenisporosarcina quisquiliarum]MCZ8536889.1 DUF899 family protein [Paenisporosarcina quisquiliarum]
MLKINSEIEELEKEILEKKQLLKKLKKAAPYVPVKNYEFIKSDGQSTSLLELFGDRNELIVVQNMGKSCSYCTMWADGFSGVYDYLAHKAPFVLATPDSPDVQASFANERNWPFPMVSTINNSFKKDMGFEKDGYQYPGVSTFKKDDDGSIFLIANDVFGPGDDYSSPWHFFDLLDSGAKGFNPNAVKMS